jgi:hypothetical protein
MVSATPRQQSKIAARWPRGVNLRMLAAGNPRIEARYALNLYLKQRGDAKFRGVDDLYRLGLRSRNVASPSAEGIWPARRRAIGASCEGRGIDGYGLVAKRNAALP